MQSIRLAKSEQHFFMQKLYTKGWKKVKNESIPGGNIVYLERIIDTRHESMKVIYRDNGWIRIE